MRRKALLFLLLFPFLKTWSQNPATIFSIPNRNVTLPCGTTCTTITATVPHIKQTTDYLLTSMPYLPYAYSTQTGTDVTSLITSSTIFDDRWTNKVPITFPFCFYGITYPTLVIGTNSAITFDSTRAASGSGYIINATTGAIPNTAYAPATIFGPYHDIDIDNTGGVDKKIEYRIEGTAPKRRFITTYNNVPFFSTSCDTYSATHQMVLYESTGVIEVYIKDKPFCSAWNSGMAILGIQDDTRTRAVAAAGKNATQWGSTGMNEAYRFTPNGGAPRFKRAELLVNGSVVTLADTASGVPGSLNLNFPAVCPTQDSTAYVLRVTYGLCNDPSNDVSYDDTVYVKRPRPSITLTAANANCATGGTITANVTGGSNFQYNLNGGAPQASNVFSNLPAGIYTVGVSAGSGCSAVTQTTISLVNNLTVNALPADTAVCTGASFTPRVTSNATSFSWTPTTAVTGPSTVLQPTLVTGNQNLKYIITATQGPCAVKDTINVTVFPGPQVNAGPDQTIINGDVIQLQATAGPGSYVWSPSTGLSATNVLRPNANPTQTITYTLTATSAQGCVSTDNVTITVMDCIDPMDAFTPNGDGVNDRWLVTNNGCFKTARVDVFNRYGARVFEDQNYSNQWDGTYKGKPVPDGTYYYIVTYTLVNGKTVYQKGNVTILR